MSNEEPKDRKDLKIQALLEKVSSLTTNYENQIADLRVELTMVSQEAEKTNGALMTELQNQQDTISRLQDELNAPESEDVPQEPDDSSE